MKNILLKLSLLTTFGVICITLTYSQGTTVGQSHTMLTRPYLQNPSNNEMTVMWMTSVPCRSWVEYGTDTLNMQRARTFIEGEMVANNKINRIVLRDLKPETKYYYRAISQEIKRYSSYHKEFGDTISTPIASFTTWSESQTDFRVLVYNDIHSNTDLFKTLHGYVGAKDYDLVVFNGDCFDDLEVETDITNRLIAYTNTYKSNEVPSIFIRGNHETRGAYSLLLWDYLARMNGRSYGSFSIGDTRFVLLDCGEDKPDETPVYYDMNDFTQHRKDQAEFLKQEIATQQYKKAKKRVLIHHIPIYGKAVEKFNPCGELWHPILAHTKFDISLNGHLHRYELIEKGKDGNNFPIVIGGGPKAASGTVMVLEKKGNKMTLDVINAKGESILNRDL